MVHGNFIKGKIFTRRAIILGGIKATLLTSLIARLSYLQIFKFKQYKTQADRNRIKPLVIPPERGIIFDRNNVALTSNERNFRVFLYINQEQYDYKQTVDRLCNVLSIDDKKRQSIFDRIHKYRKPVISILNNLTWNDLAKIEVHSYELPGIAVEGGLIRRYLYRDRMSHLLGYISLPTEKEIKKGRERKLFMHPDFRIGKSGIEKIHEKHLRGHPGIKQIEVNAYGIPVKTLSISKGEPGNNLELTIDAELQNFVVETVKDKSASVIVMDVNTGEILSMVSNPSYDPDRFVEGISNKYWQELLADYRKPLMNKSLFATYPPGSTFKMLVALAALEEGVIKPDKKINCTGSTWFGRRKFHCWKEEGHGKVDMIDAIQQSCNIYFANIGRKVSIDKISEVAKRFGLGEKYDIGAEVSAAGIVPTKAWKRKMFNEPWVPGDTVNVSIGQGFTTVTPIQLAVMMSRLVNGGIPVKPYVVKGHETTNNILVQEKTSIANSEHLDVIRKGMENVVNKKGGTMYWNRIRKKGMQMGGKTGTSQVIAKDTKEAFEENELMLDIYENHALFVGYAPIQKPKYAISVVAEHGGHGSTGAGSVAKKVLQKVQEMMI